MKELSIEEKAKAYDEAIKKLHEIITMDNRPVPPKEIGVYLFPELCESEDEKIKHDIIEFIKRNKNPFAPIPSDITLDKWIAWLEKQGEHANFRNKIQIGDKVTRNRDGMLVNLSQLNRVAKKQNEQTHADKIEPDILIEESYQQQADDLIDMVTEKHAWSEEDEKNSLDIKCLIGCYRAGDDEYRLDSWIDSLKCRVQPRQEWSEEDEEIHRKCICAMRASACGFPEEEKFVEQVDKWLKSLRPQNTWKPSDEQMKALYDSIPEMVMVISEREMLLNSLYKDLKKLREE